MNKEKQVIEWAPFKLREGVDESALIAASDAFQSKFLSHQAGFIERHLVRAADREWIDVAYWDSLENANRAVENAAKNPVVMEYFSMMAEADGEDPAAGLLHLDVIKSYA